MRIHLIDICWLTKLYCLGLIREVTSPGTMRLNISTSRLLALMLSSSAYCLPITGKRKSELHRWGDSSPSLLESGQSPLNLQKKRSESAIFTDPEVTLFFPYNDPLPQLTKCREKSLIVHTLYR